MVSGYGLDKLLHLVHGNSHRCLLCPFDKTILKRFGLVYYFIEVGSNGFCKDQSMYKWHIFLCLMPHGIFSQNPVHGSENLVTQHWKNLICRFFCVWPFEVSQNKPTGSLIFFRHRLLFCSRQYFESCSVGNVIDTLWVTRMYAKVRNDYYFSNRLD